MNRELLRLLQRFSDERTPYVLTTVVEVLGSSSAPPASQAVFDLRGNLVLGWIGGGCAQSIVAHAALDSLNDGKPRMIDIDLQDEVFGAGMPCGGNMRVFVEPVIPNPTLWLLGRGTLVQQICELASRMDFDVIVNDPGATSDSLPGASCVIHDDQQYQKLLPKAGDFVVIATHHKGDYVALRKILDSEAAYIGLVASRHRASLVLERLRDEGFSRESLARIQAPAGIDIGGKTPQEIALSIVAGMVCNRRKVP
ncbi:MAG: hypothetical protein RLZZ09_1773 [Pseudomonadota bacterium]|jgi:xanthine dehydrogenase accessory factor